MADKLPTPPKFFRTIAAWIAGVALVLTALVAAKTSFNNLVPGGVSRLEEIFGPKSKITFQEVYENSETPPLTTIAEMQEDQMIFEHISAGTASAAEIEKANKLLKGESPRVYMYGSLEVSNKGAGWRVDSADVGRPTEYWQLVKTGERPGITVWNEKTDEYLNWPLLGGKVFTSQGNMNAWKPDGTITVQFPEPVGD